MLPLLKLISDGRSYRLEEVIPKLSDEFGLNEEERSRMLPSGVSSYIKNRIGWARSYLKQAGLIVYPERGSFQVTPRGQEILRTDPSNINVKFLMQFPEFVEFRNRSQSSEEKTNTLTTAEQDDISPQEQIELAYEKIQAFLAQDLLQRIKAATPQFFERLVVDLLLAMGYGGSLKEAGKVLGKSGDGGIDGVINEDRLGLDVLYIQAKRWENVVGRPEIQKFVGALQGVRARKGVFITTSNFTAEARDYVCHLDSKVILIDGALLAGLMIEHNVGVSTQRTYAVKRLDEDYFVEE